MTHRPVDAVADVLCAAGVRRIHGVPGEGSTIDLVEAAHDRGIEYVLTAHETGAAFMAAAEAELTGRPGVCLVTKGPGLTNVATGMAHAWLDRVPLLVVTDQYPAAVAHRVERQNLPQMELFRPVVKWQAVLDTVGPRRVTEAAVRTALTLPAGPVLLALPFGPATEPAEPEASGAAGPPEAALPASAALDAAQRAIDRAGRPLLLVGMGARTGEAPRQVARFAERLGAATITTSKAKGVIPAGHPLYGGTLPGPAARRLLDLADCVVAVGFDPVELPQPWASPLPIVRLDGQAYRGTYFAPTQEVIGDVAASLEALNAGGASRQAWEVGLIAKERGAERERFADGEGLTPYRVLDLARRLLPPDTVVTVDAGAHKQLANVIWDAERPLTYLTSNGLASMAFALPAAAGAAMVTGRRAVCLTGDAGLLMALGELETVQRLGLPVTVVVFADAGHSIIRVHQLKRGLVPRGVDLTPLRFDRLADAIGGRGFAAATPDEFARALEASQAEAGLCLVSARIDPSWYRVLA